MLLEKNLTEPSIIEAFQEDCENWGDTNQLFLLLSSYLEEKTKELNSRSSVKKKKKKQTPGLGSNSQVGASPSRVFSPVLGGGSP